MKVIKYYYIKKHRVNNDKADRNMKEIEHEHS